MSDSTNERRHFTRITIDCRAQLGCADRLWQTQLIDVSLKGALLFRPEGYIDTGEPCSLELLLEPSSEIIEMHGHVVHNGGEHLGFFCQQIDMDSIAHLKRMLALNMGDESLLERELAELMGSG